MSEEEERRSENTKETSAEIAEEIPAEDPINRETELARKKRKDELFMLFVCVMIIMIFAVIGVGIYFLTGGGSSGCTCGKCVIESVYMR